MMIIQILSLVGIALAIYTLYVEYRLERGSYKAVCDINDHMSCSKAFTSKYGKTFGISNGLLGLGYYIFVLIMSFVYPIIIFYFAIFSVIMSFYFAYNLFFRVKDFCVVCISVYITNVLILIFSYSSI